MQRVVGQKLLGVGDGPRQVVVGAALGNQPAQAIPVEAAQPFPVQLDPVPINLRQQVAGVQRNGPIEVLGQGAQPLELGHVQPAGGGGVPLHGAGLQEQPGQPLGWDGQRVPPACKLEEIG